MLSPHFQPFDPRAEMTIYKRNLPHWRQKMCTYFITFRMADSIPRSVLLRWQDERQLWLQAHEVFASMHTEEGMHQYLRINPRERRQFERQQTRRLHTELDHGHGSCRLADPRTREQVAMALQHFHGDRLWCGDFVIMPNHIHWLMTPIEDWQVERLLQSIKRFTATVLTQLGLSGGTFWQKESFDRIVRNAKELMAYRQYISNNPVKARLLPESFTLYQAEWITEVLNQHHP